MNSPVRVQVTLRLPKELDKKISKQAEKLGISKNAYILISLMKVFNETESRVGQNK